MSQAHHPNQVTAQAAFDAQAQQWDVYSRAPLGRLRGDLTLHYLGRHLRRAAPRPSRSSTPAQARAAMPCPWPNRATTSACSTFPPRCWTSPAKTRPTLDPALLERLDFCQASAQEVPALYGPDRFDLILCHTLLEYVSEPRDALAGAGRRAQAGRAALAAGRQPAFRRAALGAGQGRPGKGAPGAGADALLDHALWREPPRLHRARAARDAGRAGDGDRGHLWRAHLCRLYGGRQAGRSRRSSTNCGSWNATPASWRPMRRSPATAC